MFDYLRGLDVPWPLDVLRRLARTGELELLQYVIAQGCPMGLTVYNLVCDAAMSGNVDMLIWLHAAHDVEFDNCATTSAAEEGQVHVMQYLLDHHGITPSDSLRVELSTTAKMRVPILSRW